MTLKTQEERASVHLRLLMQQEGNGLKNPVSKQATADLIVQFFEDEYQVDLKPTSTDGLSFKHEDFACWGVQVTDNPTQVKVQFRVNVPSQSDDILYAGFILQKSQDTEDEVVWDFVQEAVELQLARGVRTFPMPIHYARTLSISFDDLNEEMNDE